MPPISMVVVVSVLRVLFAVFVCPFIAGFLCRIVLEGHRDVDRVPCRDMEVPWVCAACRKTMVVEMTASRSQFVEIVIEWKLASTAAVDFVTSFFRSNATWRIHVNGKKFLTQGGLLDWMFGGPVVPVCVRAADFEESIVGVDAMVSRMCNVIYGGIAIPVDVQIPGYYGIIVSRHCMPDLPMGT
eukprot:m51a1_g3404 hypothetical protein (185) ;mRNA; r:553029-553972